MVLPGEEPPWGRWRLLLWSSCGAGWGGGALALSAWSESVLVGVCV